MRLGTPVLSVCVRADSFVPRNANASLSPWLPSRSILLLRVRCNVHRNNGMENRMKTEKQELVATVIVTEPETPPAPAKASKAVTKKTSSTKHQPTESTALATDKKPSKYDTLVSGKCPTCGGKISKHEKNTGVGERHTCGKCKHVWYLNRVIHTCKDLTVDAETRAAKTERLIIKRETAK